MTVPPPSSRRAPLLALAALLLAGCSCPPTVERYGTPAETLATWQAQLCHGDLPGEYRCLSQSLQARMRGFDTYFAARQKLFHDEPLLRWLLEHGDLPGRAVETSLSPDGRAATMRFVERGQPVDLGFVLETRGFFELADGRTLSAPQDGPLAETLRAQGRQHWLRLDLPRDLPDPPVLAGLRLESQWKIDSIDGLAPAPPPPTLDTAP